VSAAQWFEAATKYIDALRPVEGRLADDLGVVVRGTADDARWGFWGILALFVTMAAAAAALSIFVALSITRPVGQLVAAMGILAGGDTSIEVPGTDRGDEIGTMAKAVLVFRDAAIEKTRLEAETVERDRRAAAEEAERERRAAEEKAEADRRAAAEREAATAKVMNEFDAAVGGIVQAAMAGDFSQRVPLDGKEGVIRNLADALNTMCENVGKVFDDVVRMLGALAQGDLTSRITAQYQGAFAGIKDNANATAQRLSQTITEIKTAAREGCQRSRGDFDCDNRPVATDRGAGRQFGGDLGLDGGNLRSGEKERRERPASQQIGRRNPRCRKSWRRCRGSGGGSHGADRGIVPQDRRYHRRH